MSDYLWRNTPGTPLPGWEEAELDAEYGPIIDRLAYEEGDEDEDSDRRRRVNPSAWLKTTRMSQTEVALRLASFLITRRLAAAPVSVALTGAELKRNRLPSFPVAPFLEVMGFRKDGNTRDWRATYRMGTAPATLVLHDRLGQGDVVTTLASGRRMIAEVNAGPIAPTRTCNEHRLLRSAIARAVTCPFAEPGDLLLAVVPRSTRFRDLAHAFGGAPRLALTGLSIVLVDRAGTVSGCDELTQGRPIS